MATFTGESSETFMHCPIEPLAQGGIELLVSLCHLKQFLSFFKRSQRDLAYDLHHLFLLGMFDHRRDTQLWPELYTGSPPAYCLFHLAAKRAHNVLRVRVPSIRTDQDGLYSLTTGADLP